MACRSPASATSASRAATTAVCGRNTESSPWVDYDTETVDKAVEDAKKTIKAKAGLADNTIKYLADYKYGDDLLKKLAAAMR